MPDAAQAVLIPRAHASRSRHHWTRSRNARKRPRVSWHLTEHWPLWIFPGFGPRKEAASSGGLARDLWGGGLGLSLSDRDGHRGRTSSRTTGTPWCSRACKSHRSGRPRYRLENSSWPLGQDRACPASVVASAFQTKDPANSRRAAAAIASAILRMFPSYWFGLLSPRWNAGIQSR